MKGLGFERFEDYRHWLHPDIPIPVEFPPGPVQVGRLLVQKINEIEIGKVKLGIMRVEDILLDRIVMAQEWKDRQAEVQAEMLMYAHYKEMDWSDTHQKASRIGVLKLFEKIQRKVKEKQEKMQPLSPTGKKPSPGVRMILFSKTPSPSSRDCVTI